MNKDRVTPLGGGACCRRLDGNRGTPVFPVSFPSHTALGGNCGKEMGNKRRENREEKHLGSFDEGKVLRRKLGRYL
ncbi:uncharacterized [Tachysurus ichikawai]